MLEQRSVAVCWLPLDSRPVVPKGMRPSDAVKKYLMASRIDYVFALPSRGSLVNVFVNLFWSTQRPAAGVALFG